MITWSPEYLKINWAFAGLIFAYLATGCMSQADLVEPEPGDSGPDGDTDTDIDTDSDTDTGTAPQVLELPFDDNPTIPHDLKKSCTIGPDSTESSKTCPVIEWNGVFYWAYSYTDNREEMSVIAYDASESAISRIDAPGARYLHDITIDNTTETITLHGQSGDTITLFWSELIVSDPNEVPGGWLCDPVYHGLNDGCDCGCGISDSDCGSAGCTPPSCSDAACEYCFDAKVQQIPCE